MRAAIYARVSPERQEQQQTIGSQVATLRDWATARDHVPAEAHFFRDEVYSGSRLDRPALDALRDAVRDAAVDVVAVFSPDRLARKDHHPGAAAGGPAVAERRARRARAQCRAGVPPQQEARLHAALPAEVRPVRPRDPRLLLGSARWPARQVLLSLRRGGPAHDGPRDEVPAGADPSGELGAGRLGARGGPARGSRAAGGAVWAPPGRGSGR